MWSAAEGGLLLSLSSHKASVRTLAWRADSKVLASGGEDGRLTWWNAEDGFLAISHANPHPPQRANGTYGRLPNGVLSVAFAANGHLLSGGRDRHARFWNASGAQQRSFAMHSIPVQVAVSHDGKTLIAGTSTGRVHFWKLAD